MFESASQTNLNSYLTDTSIQSETNIYRNSFTEKKEYTAFRGYCLERSKSFRIEPKQTKTPESIWERKPVDFTWKLYHPHPVKRNSREAIKPWTYDKFLRPLDYSQLIDRSEENFGNQFLSESINKAFHIKKDSEGMKEFETLFKTSNALDGKVEASKTMGYRNGLPQYNGSPCTTRELINGLPEFVVASDKDPYDLKFKTQTLSQIHGPPIDAVVRSLEKGPQMGNVYIKPKPQRYDPKLILPNLKFPNKFASFTRHKLQERSATTAFWDRALPCIQHKWFEESNVLNHF